MREQDIPHPRSTAASVARVRHVLVTRSAAETVDIDARRSSAIPVVDVPVSADQEARVPGPAQDRVASPDALHIITAWLVCREAAHNAHTGDRMRSVSHTKGGHIPSLDQAPEELKESVPARLAHNVIGYASSHDDDSAIDDFPASITTGHSITMVDCIHFV